MEKLHNDDIQSAYDYIHFLNQKRRPVAAKKENNPVGELEQNSEQPVGSFTWEEVAREISNKLSKPSYDTWFNRTSGEKISPTTYMIRSETEFQKEWLESRYIKMLTEVIGKLNGSPLDLQFTIGKTIPKNGVV
ncbi:DnaA N-terminal domain-containing protein [Paenibacillus taichungensis]